MTPPIRLITFDAFDTIVRPRLPIFVSYTQIFHKHNIAVTQDAVKRAFKPSFKKVEAEFPVYGKAVGMTPWDWWGKVIAGTLEGAGVPQEVTDKALTGVVDDLMHRFGTEEGYDLFPDVLPALQALKSLPEPPHLALVSNTDSRMHSVLSSLGVGHFLEPAILSCEVGFEKPDQRVWQEAVRRTGLDGLDWEGRGGVLHVGDELAADYWGAKKAGIEALLVRREGDYSDGSRREATENLDGVQVVHGFGDVVEWVRKRNGP
ncbi:HAD hydrolase subfamily IA REG-2-like protein [Calocera viscosa TUFC12733]|uniref:HAD hydrolase subfamily IA REG-2-like protein n=1 Tax=Calocera viscosa (strain TUFC12733) TaxID=1330018 RepID=A0A167PHE8_CALVF|nr:HAD hydrolase subfamily IA REG-2-like protein [Calocera viscosa TUFC12733]